MQNWCKILLLRMMHNALAILLRKLGVMRASRTSAPFKPNLATLLLISELSSSSSSAAVYTSSSIPTFGSSNYTSRTRATPTTATVKTAKCRTDSRRRTAVRPETRGPKGRQNRARLDLMSHELLTTVYYSGDGLVKLANWSKIFRWLLFDCRFTEECFIIGTAHFKEKWKRLWKVQNEIMQFSVKLIWCKCTPNQTSFYRKSSWKKQNRRLLMKLFHEDFW